MHTIIRSSKFTLLEVMIVLFIISLGAAVTGVKISEVYKEQQFLTESQQIINQLSMAQELMMIMDTDVEVIFTFNETEKKLEMKLDVEKPLDEYSRKLIEKPIFFNGITSLEPIDQGNSRRSLFPVVIHFSLGNMTKGKLLISKKKDGFFNNGKEEFEIDLPGYPAPLKMVPKELTRVEREIDQSRLLYPSEVYEELYKDPHENQKIS
jgi:prepilin-type N-terminal cleavage/methylation domain-containing protein